MPPDPLPLSLSRLAITADGDRVILVQPAAAPPVTLAPGDLAFVVGPSGAGKSRLLRALASLDPVAEVRKKKDGQRGGAGET